MLDENSAPVLDGTKSPTLGTIAANLAAPTNGITTGGILVSSLIDTVDSSGLDNYTDADSNPPGIAITGVNSNGTLYYSTNGGTSWTQLTSSVSAASALALHADANTYVYFKPNANYSGSLTDAITFKAWDQTGGFTNGQTGVSTSPDPVVIQTIASRSLANQVVNNGNTLYTTSDNGSLRVYDITDKQNPNFLTAVSGGGLLTRSHLRSWVTS